VHTHNNGIHGVHSIGRAEEFGWCVHNVGICCRMTV
jgi:hypothetical protein